MRLGRFRLAIAMPLRPRSSIVLAEAALSRLLVDEQGLADILDFRNHALEVEGFGEYDLEDLPSISTRNARHRLEALPSAHLYCGSYSKRSMQPS